MKKLILTLLIAATFIAPIKAQDETPSTPAEGSTPPASRTPAEDAGATMRDATKAYNAGITALNANNYDEAATQFKRATELNPDDASAQMLLGYVLLKQEKWADALPPLQAARRMESKLDANSRPIVANNLGTALLNQNKPVEAITAYQRALQLNPNYGDARYNLAFALLSQKRYSEALSHLTTLQKDDAYKNDVAVLDGLGEVYESQENWPMALGFYKKATEIAPRDPQAKFKLAWGLVRAGRADNARPYLEQTVALDPNQAQAYLLLGDLNIRDHKWNEAQKMLERYAQLAPDDFTGQFNLGVAYDYDSKFDAALASYAKAEASKPGDAAVKNNIGRIYFKQNKQTEAVAKLREAIAINPTFLDARVNLALALSADEKNTELLNESNREWNKLLVTAQDELKKATGAADKAEINNHISMIYGAQADNNFKLKRFPEAAKSYEEFLKINPNNSDAMINRALALYNMKSQASLTEASRILRDVIKRDDKNATAYNNLGVVLEALFRPAEAMENYRRAAQLRPGYEEALANVKRLTP